MSGHQPRGPGVVAALGSPEEVAGFGLAGARLVPARTAEEALRGWDQLAGAALVVLTPRVAVWLAPRAAEPGAPLTVVVPA